MTRRRAFSLVEMSVLIGILLLLATLVIPNVMRMQDAMAMVTAKSNVVVFVAQAMSEAKKASVTVRLRDDSGTLVMESVQGSQDPVEIRSSTFNGKLTLESVETPPVAVPEPSPQAPAAQPEPPQPRPVPEQPFALPPPPVPPPVN